MKFNFPNQEELGKFVDVMNDNPATKLDWEKAQKTADKIRRKLEAKKHKSERAKRLFI